MSADGLSELQPEFRIDCVDVGHGSAIVIAVDRVATMVDTGPGGPILEYLLQEGIEEIDAVILSHADQDHIGGLVAIMDAGFAVRRIICNSDAAKSSKLWTSLAYSMDDMVRRGVTVEVTEALEGCEVDTVVAEISLEILAPRIRLSKLGSGGRDKEGQRLTSNTLSVVTMIKVREEPLLLFTGDIDAVGLSHLLDSGVKLNADYLVLPHHGGMMGTPAATRESIRALCEAVKPKQIFISNGRAKYDNPQPIVIDAVREDNPSLPIVCSQLSQRCSASGGPLGDGSSRLYSQGSARGHSCAGSIRLTLKDGIDQQRDETVHNLFVDTFAPTALCRGLAEGQV